MCRTLPANPSQHQRAAKVQSTCISTARRHLACNTGHSVAYTKLCSGGSHVTFPKNIAKYGLRLLPLRRRIRNNCAEEAPHVKLIRNIACY
jgi:hypothetical protein